MLLFKQRKESKKIKMIAYLSGLIIAKTDRSLIILVSGIGYRVFATNDILAEVKNGEVVELFTYTSVKEDDISLYGFRNQEELDFFQKLLTVSGIGTKMGMEILSCPMSMTKNAILTQDIATLSKIKGLGKKTAERLCLELKNKIELVMGESGKGNASGIHEDAILALESLGYDRFQILKVMPSVPKELTETEEIVKYFLKSSL